MITIKTLKDVRKFLTNIPFINYGGCGIAALAIIRWIKKNFNEDISYIYFVHTMFNPYISENNQFVKEGKGMIYAPSHVYISFRGKIFDVNSYTKKTDMLSPLQFKSEEVLVMALNNVKSWNCAFNRHDAIQKIEAYLDISLSDIKINDFK